MLSIITTSTIPFAGSSFNPNCSSSAVKIEDACGAIHAWSVGCPLRQPLQCEVVRPVQARLVHNRAPTKVLHRFLEGLGQAVHGDALRCHPQHALGGSSSRPSRFPVFQNT